MTIKQAKAVLAPLNITIRRSYGEEFCVRIKGSPAGHGYFTTDINDAVQTGKLMAQQEAMRIAKK